MDDVTVPQTHRDLLARPLFAHLATVRPDGGPQSSVMWFDWDGERARFSHTRARQKHRNLQHEPRVSFHVQDPDNPYRTLEVRGIVESIAPDVDATFYRSLQHRYDFVTEVFDAEIRIVVTVRPTSFVAVDGGLTPRELQALTEQLSEESSNER
jgi:PPOX class probable F420-dependent enzyme